MDLTSSLGPGRWKAVGSWWPSLRSGFNEKLEIHRSENLQWLCSLGRSNQPACRAFDLRRPSVQSLVVGSAQRHVDRLFVGHKCQSCETCTEVSGSRLPTSTSTSDYNQQTYFVAHTHIYPVSMTDRLLPFLSIATTRTFRPTSETIMYTSCNKIKYTPDDAAAGTLIKSWSRMRISSCVEVVVHVLRTYSSNFHQHRSSSLLVALIDRDAHWQESEHVRTV